MPGFRALLPLGLAAGWGAADLATTTIFTHGERADCTCIRGPTLLLAGGDTLVAFAGCVPAAGDNCQPLRAAKPPPGAVHRQVYKRSTSGGSTWGPLTDAPELGGSPVALSNGSLLLFTGTGIYRSDNGAASWLPSGNHSGGAGGGIIQLSATHPSHPNRLLSVRKGPGAVGEKAALTSYSDSDGRAWTASTTQQARMDESELVELGDGAVAIFSRNWLNCSSIPADAPCREHQDGPCMCTAVATSVDGVASFTSPSEPAPSLAGANCHSSSLTLDNVTYLAAPMYTGPPRLPNQPHKPCGYDPVSKRTGHCYTDRAPNRINGRVMVASASSAAGVRDWSVHARVTVGGPCSTEAECAESAGFGYSSMSALPDKLWPRHFAVAYETTSPDCGYDPQQKTATGMGSATSACKIVMAVVPRKTDDPAGQVADAALHARLAKLTGRAHIFDVRRFGAKGDGATTDTAVRVCPSPKSSKSR